MNGRLVEIFKVGVHTDSAGKTHPYTVADLDDIAKKYNEQPAENRHEAPITIGHPKDNKPAWGWVDYLKRIGTKLYAVPKDVVAEFQDMFDKKMFKKKSISLYPDGLLRHIAFLGAVPPAVKGLSDALFGENEPEAIVFDFEETETDEFEELTNQITALKADLTAKSEEINTLKTFKEENDKLKEAIEMKETDMKVVQERMNSVNLKLRTLEFSQYLNERIAYSNLTPAQVTVAEKILKALDSIQFAEDKQGIEIVSFNEKDEKLTEVVNPIAIFKQFVELLKVENPLQHQDFSQGQNSEDDRVAKAKKLIAEHKAKGKKLTMAEALDKVS